MVLWNVDKKQQILSSLNDMKDYGIRLEKQGFIKGKKARKLADKLTLSLQLLDNIEDVNIDQKKTHILNIKLQLINTLHSEDSHFALHRGYTRIINNILSLFTFCIANVINQAITGNWSFFNTTATEDKVANLQTLLGVESNESVNLNLMTE